MSIRRGKKKDSWNNNQARNPYSILPWKEVRKDKVITVTHSTGYDEIYLLAGDNMQVQDGLMATPSENAKKGEIKRLFTSTLKGNKQSRVMLNKFISKVA